MDRGNLSDEICAAEFLLRLRLAGLLLDGLLPSRRTWAQGGTSKRIREVTPAQAPGRCCGLTNTKPTLLAATGLLRRYQRIFQRIPYELPLLIFLAAAVIFNGFNIRGAAHTGEECAEHRPLHRARWLQL